MFLNTLTKQQKELFLNLAIKAAEANGVIAHEERTMLKAFAQEMRLTPRFVTEVETNEILDSFVEISDARSNRVILFELLGLMYADADYDEKERTFINAVTERLSISQATLDRMNTLLSQYASVFEDICNMING